MQLISHASKQILNRQGNAFLGGSDTWPGIMLSALCCPPLHPRPREGDETAGRKRHVLNADQSHLIRIIDSSINCAGHPPEGKAKVPAMWSQIVTLGPLD